MNFLAHIYLSGKEEQIKIGNFMGDYIKGKAFHIYPDKIKEGILLHRYIDSFTDSNKNTLEAKQLFTPKYRKYSGIIIDIIYDHFLAGNWEQFSSIHLKDYIENFHQLLYKYQEMMPSDVQEMFPRLIRNQRLYSYRKIEGIKDVLSTMAKYTSLPDHSEFAIITLQENYGYLKNLFFKFFKEIIYYIETVHNVDLTSE
ncbi:MAG: ACP phosphodiesterase [Bacteroidales bacterium]